MSARTIAKEMAGDSRGEGLVGLAPCGAWRWRPSAGADEAGALACRAAPPRLLRAAWGAHVDAAARSSDGQTWYTVNVRWLETGEGGPLAAHAICSCPDKRQGYCKHAAAVLKAAAAQRGAASGGDEAPWLRAAYGAPREPVLAPDLEVLPLPASVLRRVELFRAEERALDLLGAEGTAALLLGTIMAPRSSEPGVPDDGEVLSRLFGGEDAASEAYQLMTATRAFDAMRRLKASQSVLRVTRTRSATASAQRLSGCLYLYKPDYYLTGAKGNEALARRIKQSRRLRCGMTRTRRPCAPWW
jgi:hypothetical protein